MRVDSRPASECFLAIAHVPHLQKRRQGCSRIDAPTAHSFLLLCGSDDALVSPFGLKAADTAFALSPSSRGAALPLLPASSRYRADRKGAAASAEFHCRVPECMPRADSPLHHSSALRQPPAWQTYLACSHRVSLILAAVESCFRDPGRQCCSPICAMLAADKERGLGHSAGVDRLDSPGHPL